MNTATNGMTAELPVIKSVKTIKKSAPKPKPIKKPARQPKPKAIADLPTLEAMQNENKLESDVLWYDLEALRRQKTEEEPLHVLVYFRTEKQKNSLIRHGRITFSKFLSAKIGTNKKIKFGSLEGKVIFQINEKDGFNTKLGSKMYTKRVVANCHISEIIFDRFKLHANKKSVPLRLKDLGNNFYQIDEIIK